MILLCHRPQSSVLENSLLPMSAELEPDLYVHTLGFFISFLFVILLNWRISIFDLCCSINFLMTRRIFSDTFGTGDKFTMKSINGEHRDISVAREELHETMTGVATLDAYSMLFDRISVVDVSLVVSSAIAMAYTVFIMQFPVYATSCGTVASLCYIDLSHASMLEISDATSLCCSDYVSSIRSDSMSRQSAIRRHGQLSTRSFRALGVMDSIDGGGWCAAY